MRCLEAALGPILVAYQPIQNADGRPSEQTAGEVPAQLGVRASTSSLGHDGARGGRVGSHALMSLEHRQEQFAQVPIRLLELPQEQFGVLNRIVLHCCGGHNYVTHSWTFTLADFVRELGWENASSSKKERDAARQRLRRYLDA